MFPVLQKGLWCPRSQPYRREVSRHPLCFLGFLTCLSPDINTINIAEYFDET